MWLFKKIKLSTISVKRTRQELPIDNMFTERGILSNNQITLFFRFTSVIKIGMVLSKMGLNQGVTTN